MIIETVIFDLDGTLIDSSTTNANAFQYAVSPFGITLSQNEIDEMRSLTANELFLDKLSKMDAKQALKRLWEYSDRSSSETILLPGVLAALNRIAAKGMTLGLWTGRDKASAIKILQHHQLAPYFKSMVAGCEVSQNKPNPEGLLLLAKRLNASLETMIHVGDHEHDLIGAKAAGVLSVHAKWHHANQNDHALAQMSFDAIHEFESWLQL